MSLVFKLTDLQERREPKKQKDFLISYKGVPQEKEEEKEEKKEEDKEKKEKKEEKHVVLFLDQRNNTLVDRSLILKRLNRFVTSNKESQSPILEEDVQKEREREKPEDVVVVVDEVEEVEVERNIPEKRIENELEQAIQSVVEKQPKEKKTRKRTKEGVVISTDNRKVDLSLAKIGDQLIKDRLPPPSKYSVPISSYYLNNRKIYISNLAKLFRPYSNKILAKSDQLSCKTLHSENIDFGLLTHQLVVRDYLNLYTPYRGLLLYHGLGSGKTCTSIGIAEGMKSEKQVILMTPASLKTNFFNELKKCGDALYKKNQYWEFINDWIC